MAEIPILIAILVILQVIGVALITYRREVATRWVVVWFITYLGVLGMVIF